MRDSIRMGLMFNIIDTDRGEKADLIPITMVSRYRQTFRRRVRKPVKVPGMLMVVVWCARPEDVILGKPMAWIKGRSRKHETDIYEMMVFHYLGLDPDTSAAFDESFVDAQARALGTCQSGCPAGGQARIVRHPTWISVRARPIGFQPAVFQTGCLAISAETGRRQLYLTGRNMTVGQLVYTMRANDLEAEAAAKDLELPLEQVQEALVYYETHRDLIESEADEERRSLQERGMDLEPQALPG
jgi:uncharacterized protein (DUF433 family)